MYPRDEIWAERLMHRPVAGDAAQPLERVTPDTHIVMALTALLISAVPTVAFAVIHNQQLAWRKCLTQPIFNLLCLRHIFLPPPPSISLPSV